MTRLIKWLFSIVAVGFLAGLIWVVRLLHHHAFVEAFAVFYLLMAGLNFFFTIYGVVVNTQQSLLARIWLNSWSSSSLGSKIHSAAVEIITVAVSALNWPGTFLLSARQLQNNHLRNQRSLQAQIGLYSLASEYQYHHAITDAVGASVIVWVARSQPVSIGLELLALTVVVSIMLRHILLLISPGGTLDVIRRQRYSPFISYTVLTACDLLSLTFITALSGLWFFHIPINVGALRSAGTTLLEGPKYLLASLIPGATASMKSVLHAPFHQQLILIAGVLFYTSIIRVFSSRNSVFRRNEDDFVALSAQCIAAGAYDEALIHLKPITHITVESEMTRSRAHLALGQIPEARASVRRRMNIDPTYIYDPTPTDVFYGLFEIVTTCLDVAPALWDAALHANLSQGMLFESFLADRLLVRLNHKEQPALARGSVGGSPLLEAGICLFEGDTQASQTALNSMTPADAAERFVFSTLKCLVEVSFSPTQDDAASYLDQWMEKESVPFQATASELMQGRIWERALAMDLLAILEAGLGNVNDTATVFVSALKQEATEAVSRAVANYKVTQGYVQDNLPLAAPPATDTPALAQPSAEM